MNNPSSVCGRIYIHPLEHALSPLGRFHRLSSYRQFNTATNELTQDISSLCPAALSRPSFRDMYKAFSNEDYEAFLSSHTLYSFYKPFTPSSVLGNLSNNKAILPEGHRNIRYTQAWRWCPDCVQSDIQEYGFPYFHTEHQLPVMTQCYKHDRRLISGCECCNVDWKKIDKLGMPNSKEECPKCSTAVTSLESFHDGDIAWLQETSLRLLNGDTPHFTLAKLQRAYQEWLGIPYRSETKGVLSLAERKILNDAQFKLDNHFDPRLYHAIFTNADVDPNKKRSPNLSLFKATFKPELFLSPIVHLMIIRMMFGSIDTLHQSINS